MAVNSNASAISKAASGRRKPLTERQEEALQNLIRYNFTDPKQAFLDAGYDTKSVYAAMRALKDEIIELTEMFLVESAPYAAQTLLRVMTSEDAIPNASQKLDASKTILDRVGIGKKERVDVTHNVPNGIFVLPAKKVEEPIEAEFTHVEE